MDKEKLLNRKSIKCIRNIYRFLKAGERGEYTFCTLFAAQFIYGLLPQSVFHIFTRPVVLLGCILLTFAGIEISFRLLYFLLGIRKKGRISFWAAVVAVGLSAAYGTQLRRLFSSVLIGFAATLAVDIFGRCLYSVFQKQQRREPLYYMVTTVSFCMVVLFGLFFHGTLSAGKSYTVYEDEEKSNVESVKSGVNPYIQNGAYKVSVMDYGASRDKDIQTKGIDLSSYVSYKGITKFLHKLYFKQGLDCVPIAGRIWYPDEKTDNPVLFIVHGNHAFTVEAHLGYDYLGEYLASNGYVVVSVDENMLNELSGENGGRAILLLENIRTILEENEKEESPLYQRINPEKIGIAGHSRGGEAVALAYELNQLDVYPDNGNLHLNYHFPITSVIAIAPCVDQYMPAGHSVKLTDVNYLLLHGSQDQDVTNVMGEKQYRNVTFSGKNSYEKASVYIIGGNHGQFNSLWGRYDLTGSQAGFLNTGNMISQEEQQWIAKVYIRAFLDYTLLNTGPYEEVIMKEQDAGTLLPDTACRITHQSSDFQTLCSFENDGDITVGSTEHIKVHCKGTSMWKIQKDAYGKGIDDENHVLRLTWKTGSKEPGTEITFSAMDFTNKNISFRVADMREAENLSPISCKVTLYDGQNRKAVTSCLVQPSVPSQLYKQDILTNQYEYKHQMETISVPFDTFQREKEFDETQVTRLVISFSSEEAGNIILDDIGVYEYQK